MDAENDADSDAICGNEDSCAYDAENDADSDAVCGDVDSCPYALFDSDSDALCDNIDSCANDAENNDEDSDNLCGAVDSCPQDFDNDANGDNLCTDFCSSDIDSDDICDIDDSCTLDSENDVDSDLLCANLDSCDNDSNNDADGDNICDDIAENLNMCGFSESSFSILHSDLFIDSTGDLCPNAVNMDETQKASVIANIEADFSSAGIGVSLTSDPVFLTDDTVRFNVRSALSQDMVKENIANMLGVGVSFVSVVELRRLRRLRQRILSETSSDMQVIITLNGLVDKFRSDADGDNIIDNLDSCPYDAENDVDDDLLCELAYCFDNLYNLNPQCADYRPEGRFAGLCVDDDVCTACSCSCSSECFGTGASDVCPTDATNDADSDTLCGGDDICPFDAENDFDSDGVCGSTTPCVEDTDNQITVHGTCLDYAPGAANQDYCIVDDLCDVCPCSCAQACDLQIDICPQDSQNDVDSDNICAEVDSCPLDGENDSDGDNVCARYDSCPEDIFNDLDSDSICTSIDSCPFDSENDVDDDGMCGDEDDCPFSSNGDSDGDGLCDDVDTCQNDAQNDADSDNICGDLDPCPDDRVECTDNALQDSFEDLTFDDETLIIAIAVPVSVIVIIIVVVVIVICVKKNSDAATRRVDYLSHSEGQFNANSKSAAANKSLDHNTTPAAVQPKTIENDNDKYIGRPTHRKLSNSSTKGHKHRSKKNSKKRQTKPTSSQSRKSRHQRSPSKSRRGRGSSTSSRDVGKSEKGNDMKWTPDPDTMSSGEFERSLTKFFRKYNDAKVIMVPKMAKIYNKKRGRLFTKLYQAYKAVPGGAKLIR
jgi:hypothetical protein